MAFPLTAGRGVTQVIDRCESAKTSGFLDLSSCSLMYVADAIYLVLKGYDVTKLSVRNNCLKKFPMKFITKFPNLCIFNMEGNMITEMPSELSEWTSMKGINLGNNKLTQFPEGIYSMSQLALLDLSGNAITDIDVDRLYSSCPSLLQLNLTGNDISSELKQKLSSHSSKPAKLAIKFE